jgi:hypothetical protein
MVKVRAALVSMPPSAVPPLSWSWTLIVAEPLASAAGVKVSVPSAATAGCDENSAVLLLVAMKFSACPLHPRAPSRRRLP